MLRRDRGGNAGGRRLDERRRVRRCNVLQHNFQRWKIPHDPSQLSLDVSALHVNQHLEAKDLVLPEGVTLIEEPNRVIVAISVAKAEEEAAPAEGALAEGAPAEPEVIGRGKADEEEEEGDE